MPEICYKVIPSSFLKQEVENPNREISGNAEVFCVQFTTPLAQERKELGSIHVAVYLQNPAREILYSGMLH